MILRISNFDQEHHLHVHQGMRHHGPEAGKPDGRWRWRIFENVLGGAEGVATNYEVTRALSPVQGWLSYDGACEDAREFLAGIGAKYEEVQDG